MFICAPSGRVRGGWKATAVFGYPAVAATVEWKLIFMRLANSALVVIVFFSAAFSSGLSFGQAQPAAATAPSNATTPPQPPSVTTPAPSPASSILKPSLDGLQQTLGSLRVERWKRGSIRDEASADIDSIQQDMQQHVPGLLQDADGAPGTLSKALPLARHVDALYDVLLRVVEAARFVAPDDQASQLRDALANLGKARLALDDSMETSAGFQEKQLVDLRVTVQKQAAFKCPAPPPAPECPKAPAKKPVRKKPATPAAGTPQGPGQKAPANGTQPQKTPTGQPPANGTTQQKPAAAKPSAGTQQKPPSQNQ
jgi:hypothetical protein